jgi:hypothetical protein
MRAMAARVALVVGTVAVGVGCNTILGVSDLPLPSEAGVDASVVAAEAASNEGAPDSELDQDVTTVSNSSGSSAGSSSGSSNNDKGTINSVPDSSIGSTVALTACSNNTPCPSGQSCVNSFCKVNCSSILACPTNWSCDEYYDNADGGIGQEFCDPHCNPLTPQQSDGEHVACPSGMACVFFVSPDQATWTDCVTAGPLTSGESCRVNTTASLNSCVTGDVCLGTPGICKQYCRIDLDDCGANMCKDFSTNNYDNLQRIGFCDRPCTTNADCGSGELCDANECVAKCAVDSDCAATATCEAVASEDGGVAGSRCHSRCSPVAPQQSDITHVGCSASESCHVELDANGMTYTDCLTPGTIPTGGSCMGDEDCPSGDGCFGQPGICRAYCRTALNDCGSAATCNTIKPSYFDNPGQQIGLCVPSCTASSDCASNQFCNSYSTPGSCDPRCSSDSDCGHLGTCDTVTNVVDGGVAGSSCYFHCNPLDPTRADATHVACSADQTCAIDYDPSRQRSYTYCESVQSKAISGQACTTFTDCSVGQDCVSYGTATAVCAELCNVASVNCAAAVPCDQYTQPLYDGTVQIGTCKPNGM